MSKSVQKVSVTQDLNVAALSLQLAPTQRDVLLHMAAIHIDATVTQTVTLKIRTDDGVEFDILLDSTSLSSAQDYLYNPSKPVLIRAGWTVTLACTDTGISSATNANATLVYQER